MSSFAGGHPGEDLLLRYLDGESPAREADEIRRHLEACWQCRAEVEELGKTIADCMRYRKTVLAEQLPAPPAPWQDLSRGFARVDAELAAESRRARWTGWLGAPAFRRWAVAGAAVVLACALYFQLRETPSVQAAALLRRAVTAAREHPPQPRRIQVKTRTRQFRMEDRAAAPVVEALFRGSAYRWTEPLSAKAYADWRDAQPRKADEVTPLAAGYRIRTTVAEGAVVEANLTLRARDLQPVESRFEFRNRDWIEFSELSESPMREDGTSVETSTGTPSRRAEPSQPAAPGSAASISEELRVIAALHEIGADLGDPLEISRTERAIVVSGVGVAPERQQEIRRSLEALPHVSVDFTQPALSTLPQEQPPAGPASIATKPAGLQSALEQQFGGRAEFERVSGQLLDWNEAAMARAYALRALAQRFLENGEAGMAPGDRRMLRDLGRSHLSALAAQSGSIEQALTPALKAMGARPATVTAPPAGSWQAAAEEVFRSARRVEVLLSRLLGATGQESAGPVAAEDVASAMVSLRAAIASCQARLENPSGAP